MSALWFWAVDLPEPVRVLKLGQTRFPATPQTIAIGKALEANDARWRQSQQASDAELAEAQRGLIRMLSDEHRLRRLQLRQLEREEQKLQQRAKRTTKQQTNPATKSISRMEANRAFVAEEIKELEKNELPVKATSLSAWLLAAHKIGVSLKTMRRYIAAARMIGTKGQN